MPAGRLIGAEIAASPLKSMLIPIGMVMGYFVVSAKPAVHSLKRQVSEITNGGTIIKGRLAEIEQFAALGKTDMDGERELLCILAPLETSKQIMEDVNEEFGLKSDAKGILFAIPTEKAYKI